jgi:NAD(P)-dependent dehydrogenase (short-subunit alcohol dehydrogenase family)
MSSRKRRWLITGVSSGLGQALAETVVARGDCVLGTFRKREQVMAFEKLAPGRTFACGLDLAESGAAHRVLGPAIDRAGGVDVVVNNAGYGLTGAVEEVSDTEARREMEVNFFGALAVTQIALPYLRRQRSGHIINITSVAGRIGFGGLSLYCASKFALEGLGLSLALETRHLGIKVTNVEPGSFRTNWRSPGALVDAATVIDDYGESVGAQRARLAAGRGQQEGDPRRAAEAIIQVVESPTPLLHLALNSQAWEAIHKSLTAAVAEMDEWSQVSHSTVFPASSRGIASS